MTDWENIDVPNVYVKNLKFINLEETYLESFEGLNVKLGICLKLNDRGVLKFREANFKQK
jgi:hypothetical protein